MLRLADFNTYYDADSAVRQYLDRKMEYMANRKDVTFALIVPGKSSSLDVVGRARKYTIRGKRRPFDDHGRWILSPRELRRVLKAERPHLLEIGAPFVSPWLGHISAAGIETKLVGFWYQNVPTTLAGSATRFGRPLASIAEGLAWSWARATFNSFHATLTTSSVTAETLRAHGIENVHETPAGVNVELFTPLRRQTDPERKLVGYVGGLSEEKGFGTLCRAFPLILASQPGVGLHIAGDGPLREAARDLERQYSNVRYYGYISDPLEVAELTADLDCAVVPGEVERFSMSAVEAFSCGVPVVAADPGGARELVRESEAGLLYQAGNETDLARAVVEVLSWPDEKAQSVRAEGRDFVLRRHAWDRVFDHKIALYRRIVGRLAAWE
ncbi:MAG: glycosyltransferase [Myxococcales bacterium]|nr:glycosyltransferase [Myxococcales bacterium]